MAHDFTMYSGDTKDVLVQVLDENNLIVDITGATIKWQVAQNTEPTTPILTKTTASGIDIVDGESGLFQINLTTSDTASLSGKYYHEAQVTELNSDISTVMAGIMTILPDLVV